LTARPFCAVSALLFGLLATLVTRARADEAGTLAIGRSGTNVLISWTNSSAVLQSSLAVTGVWNELTGAVSPYTVVPTNHASFYRLQLALVPLNFEFRYVAPLFTTLIGDPSSSCGCASPENPNGTTVGGSSQDNGMGNVFLHTGELVQHAVDMTIAGRGFDWRFERHYRSGMNYDGPLGYGWEFNYNRRLAMQTNGDVLRMDGAGRADRYVLTSGSFQAPSGFYTQLIQTNGGSFVERDRHGMRWFYAPTNALGIAQMTSMLDRNSNQMTFQYNTLGQLTNVTDTLQRPITYGYDGNGRLTTVVDFTGRMLQFVYDANGDLISETSPGVSGTPNGNDFLLGKKTTYTYSSGFPDARFNHDLLTVTAPNEVAGGPPRLAAQYNTNSASQDADRLISLRLGGTNASGVAAGGAIYYGYAGLGVAAPTNFTMAVFQTTVTNRNGNVTQYEFNQLGNIVGTVQFTNGVRSGGPSSFTTLFAHNKDGELIARTGAEGDVTLYTYSTNSDRFQQGNLLQTLRLPGPRGGDQANGILFTNSYEPKFNFIATTTDGRGNTTTYSYDQNGNRTNIVHRIPSIVEDFEYNGYGQVTAHVLPDNGSGHRRRDVMTYYSSVPQTGYLQNQIVDAGPTNFNLTTTYEHDARGNVVHTIDPRGNDNFSVVNALDQVVRTISPTAPGGVRYTNDTYFDANDNVMLTVIDNRDATGAQDPAMPGIETFASYDILDQAITNQQQVSATQFITSATRYDANQNRVLSISPEAVAGRQANNVLQTIYDERDLVFQEIRAPGDPGHSTTQYDYDGDRNLVRTMQGLEDTPRTTLYAYDGYNRRTNTTDAMGNVTTTHYDSNGNATNTAVFGELIDVPGSAGDTNLSSLTTTFDPMDRVVTNDAAFFDAQTQAPIGGGHAITRTVYSSASQVLLGYDANNNPTTTAYDSANRSSLVTDAKGNMVAYIYDANNNPATNIQTDLSDLGNPSQWFTNRSTYDNLNRLTAAIDNLNNTNCVAYDSRNNRTLLIDARGNFTTNVFDGLNRLTATLRALTRSGDNTTSSYATITNRQAWDDDSRLISQIDSNTNATRYSYDALNRQTSTLVADGTSNSIAFDVHGNIVSTTDANQTTVTNHYDLLNRVIGKQVTPGPGVSAATTLEGFMYDGLSRLISATNNQTSLGRSYDSLGRVLSETQIMFGGSNQNTTVLSSYDAVGNQLTCQYPGLTRTVTTYYDSLNRKKVITSLGITNATFSFIGPGRLESRTNGNGTYTLYAYDGARRETNITHYGVGGIPFESHDFTWDPAYNKAQHSYLRADLPNVSRFLTNDSLNRLVGSVAPWATNLYALDGLGNRTNGYEFNSVNEYTNTPFGANTFDANGNYTQANNTDGTTTYVYDYRNLMVNLQPPLSSTTFYTYDALGRRVAKSSGSGTTRFLYDGWRELEEQADGVTQAAYIYGDYIDDIITMRRLGSDYYYHSDDLYNVTALTDSAANVVERYDYDDYGRPLNATNGQPILGAPSSVGNALLFTGRRLDPESGLYYCRNRYLEPRNGRFMTRDLEGYLQGMNLYEYANSGPAGAVDPLGLLKMTGPLVIKVTEGDEMVFEVEAPGGKIEVTVKLGGKIEVKENQIVSIKDVTKTKRTYGSKDITEAKPPVQKPPVTAPEEEKKKKTPEERPKVVERKKEEETRLTHFTTPVYWDPKLNVLWAIGNHGRVVCLKKYLDENGLHYVNERHQFLYIPIKCPTEQPSDVAQPPEFSPEQTAATGGETFAASNPGVIGD
jgi:RHS repeat-associated protein